MFCCTYFEAMQCSSCDLLAKGGVGNALANKEERYREEVKALFGPDVPVAGIFSPTKIEGSRAKAKMAVSGDIDVPVVGILNRELQGVEVLHCPLHLPKINELLSYLPRFITEHKIYPYVISRKLGELKYLIIISNHDATEIIVRFVMRTKDLQKRISAAIPQLQKAFPQVKVVTLNIQAIPHAIIEGPEEIVLTEESHISENYGAFSVQFGPQSFIQVTPEVASELYAYVGATIGKLGVKRLLDLYCGVGGFSFAAAPHIISGHGVELSEDAILCAKNGAKVNGFNNLTFESADVDEYLVRKQANVASLDCVVVNPPRRGLSAKVVQAILAIAPAYVIYSSCNPTTQFRDIHNLSINYNPLQFAPFDMFPLTDHIESVIILKKSL